MSENQNIKKTADELFNKVMTGNFVKTTEKSKEDIEADEEARREAHMLDERENSPKYKFFGG